MTVLEVKENLISTSHAWEVTVVDLFNDKYDRKYRCYGDFIADKEIDHLELIAREAIELYVIDGLLHIEIYVNTNN